MPNRSDRTLAPVTVVCMLASTAAVAQGEPKQVVKPPIAQAWIDVATYSGFGIPAGMGGGQGGQGMMGATLGALFGGGANKADFGYTQFGPAGRWMDVTLYTSRNTNLQQALQSVPEATGLAPTLKLETPEKPKPAARTPDDDSPTEIDSQPPKGKLVMYWGCSETVRPGQPKIVNLETATIAELGKFFESRHATQRGTHATVGQPVWPSRSDKRTFPAGASIVGQHAYSGEGVPESFKFSIQPAQDIMPALKLTQTDKNTFLQLEWNAIPTARAYFLGTMGALPGSEGGEGMGMVIWTSSELPDSGFGLFDYQTNPAVDKWLKEKVLLPPTTTRCAIPKEAAGQGMLRAIAYGTNVDMAYPPRPADPKIPWEPEWNVKLRVKSMTTTMIGMPEGGGMPGAEGADTDSMTDAPPPAEGQPQQAPPPEKKKKSKWNPLEAVKEAVEAIPH